MQVDISTLIIIISSNTYSINIQPLILMPA